MDTKELVAMLIAEKAKGIQHVTFDKEKCVDLSTFKRAFISLVENAEYYNFFVPIALKYRKYYGTFEEQESNPYDGNRHLSEITYKELYDHLSRHKEFVWATSYVSLENNLYVTKEGKFMIRFAKEFYKKHGVKLPEKFIGVLGSQLNTCIEEPESYHFDFTNVFDWKDGEFGHRGSCWWPGGGYDASLPTFQHGGGWAIRFYRNGAENGHDKQENYNRGNARTWIHPAQDSLLCFNTYGNEIKDVYAVLRHVMSQYTQDDVKLTCRVNIGNNYSNSTPYVNGGSGFAVSDSHLWDSGDSHDLDMAIVECEESDSYFECESCGDRHHMDDSYYVQGDTLCSDCYHSDCSQCYRCDDDFYDENMVSMADTHRNYCQRCAEHVGYSVCDICGDCNENDYTVTEDTERCLCSDCDSDIAQCHECNEVVENHETVDGNEYCESCAEDRRAEIAEENNIETT